MPRKPITSTKLSILDVLKPTALIATQCEAGKDTDKDVTALLEVIGAIKNVDSRVHSLALFLLDSSCRVSEALGLQPHNIDKLYRVKIVEKKTKSTRIIHTHYSREIIEYMRASNINVWSELNRFYVYRVFKKVGLFGTFGTNKRASVTHSIRHESALIAQNQGFSETDTQKIIGHKSVNSTLHYLRKKQK